MKKHLQNCLCVIPARGGSKRIPRKNVVDFAGKPLIAHSIENALNSGVFDEVIVSTDDEQIASVAKAYKASVPFMRPKELCDDFISSNAAITHAIKEFSKKGLNLAVFAAFMLLLHSLTAGFCAKLMLNLKTMNTSFCSVLVLLITRYSGLLRLIMKKE